MQRHQSRRHGKRNRSICNNSYIDLTARHPREVGFAMYEHVTCFIDDIERGAPGSELEGALIKALYHPEIVDKDYLRAIGLLLNLD